MKKRSFFFICSQMKNLKLTTHIRLLFLGAFLFCISPTWALVQITGISTQPTSCYGSSDGTIVVTATGGSGTLKYSLDNFVTQQGSNIFTNLAQGSYTVYVRDASNESDADWETASISQPNILQIDGTVTTQNTCSASPNGTITANVSGGTTPYTYSLSNTYSPSQSASVFTGLSSGNYTVFVKDAKNCTAQTLTNSVVITQNVVALNNTPTVTNATCYGGQGSVLIEITGGSKYPSGDPYLITLTKDNQAFSITNKTFVSGNSVTTLTITNLPKGIYSGSINDATGCPITVAFEVTEPTQVTAFAQNIKSNTCASDAAGSLDILIVGGVAPYTVICTSPAIFNGTILTTGSISKITGLAAGVYQFSVADSKSCTSVLAQVSATITAPTALTFDPTKDIVQGVECNGSTTGAIQVEAQGGTTPYSYSISAKNTLLSYGNNTGLFEDLPADTFYVKVKDANNCITNHSDVIVTQPELLSAELMSTTKIVCKGQKTGSVKFKIIDRIQAAGLLKSDTTSYYSAKLYNITNAIEVTSANFTISNKLHPELVGSHREPVLDAEGDSTYTADSVLIMKNVKDTLWTQGCHESAKEATITNYTTDLKGFDCYDYVTISGLEECAYRLELYKGNCMIGKYFEFVIGRTGDVPTATLNGIAPMCDGVEVTITPTITAVPATTTYKWTLEDVTVGTTKNLTKTFILEETGRKLKLETTNACGTVATNKITIAVFPRPTASITTDKEAICEGQSTDMTVFLAGKAPFTYTVTGYDPVTTLNVSETQVITPASSTSLTIESLTDANCTATAADITGTNITVYPKPIFNTDLHIPEPMVSGRYITATITPGFLQYNLWINNVPVESVEGQSNIFKYKDFVYGTSSNVFDTKIVDTNGCKWDSTMTADITSVVFPNIFTPNNDGVNDVFLEGYNLRVYDRLGNLLYIGTNGWDGSHNGVIVNSGVYLYTVEVPDEEGKIVVIKNTVMLEK